MNYNFDTAVVANSFKAHQLIQLAKSKNLGDAAEERLFSAYFIEGKNFGSETVLLELGKEIGLTETDLADLFTNPVYKDNVNKDIAEARNIGVTGVPFFVFDRKFAVSGAQPAESFVQALEQSLGEWKESNPEKLQNLSEGDSCDVNGNCD